MTTITVVGATSTDETLGNQADDLLSGADFGIAEQEAEDNGTPLTGDLGAVQAAFAGLVLDYGLATARPLELSGAIQLSGDQDADVTVSGAAGPIEDLSFTDGSGAPLKTYAAGVTGLASGLTTLDGEAIWLYAGTNTDGTANADVVLGYTADGDLVFAIALQTLSTGGAITGGTFWTALYEPLAHPDPTQANEAVHLPDTLNIGVTETLQFGFSQAPSGNALFMMFAASGNGSVGIVVTGEQPDNPATNKANDGDTVNTGQGGGPTTLGSNGQQLKAGVGLVFTFVDNPDPSYTVPGLSSPESKAEGNIRFADEYDAMGGGFTVSQVTPTNSVFTVNIVAYAIDLVNAQTGANYTRSNYVESLAVDVPVAITGVFVNGVAVAFTALADGGVSVAGITNGDTVTYTTAVYHQRVLIENGQPAGSNITFDIGGFELASTTSTRAPVGDLLRFHDDAPSLGLSGTRPTLTTDDTDAGDGVADGDASGAAGVASASFAGAFKDLAYGTDGPLDLDDDGTADAGAAVYALDIKGDATDNLLSGLYDTQSGQQVVLRLVGGKVEGYVTIGGTATRVFEVAVAADGTVTLTQWRAVRHDDPADPSETGPSTATLGAADLVTLSLTLKDDDGDTARASVDIGQALRFEDAGPSVALSGNAYSVRVDETDIAGATGTSASQSFAGAFTPAYGKDGALAGDALTFALAAAAGSDSGLNDALTGQDILLRVANGAVEGYLAGATGTVAFRVTVNTDGLVTLTQLRAVEHDDPSDPDEATSPAAVAAGRIALTATAIDGDGDTASRSLDLGPGLLFEDDGPRVDPKDPPPVLTVDESALGQAGATATAGFANAFLVAYGKDGPLDANDDQAADAGALAFTLDIKGAADDGLASGLVDTLTGQGVTLRMNGAAVEGYVTIAGAKVAVFTIAVDAATGAVTLTQHRSVEHDDPLDPDEPGASAATLAADLVTLTATARDGDDGASDTAALSINVGGSFRFRDDGPSVTASGALPTLSTDDSDTPGDSASTSFAGAFAVGWGADGPKDVDENGEDADALTYALGLKGGATTGVATALADALTGAAVLLEMSGALVRGYAVIGGVKTTVFTIAVDTTGLVTLTQDRSIAHDDPLDPVESGAAAATLAADLVTLTAIALDGDDGASDRATATRAIGDAFRFEDAGPTLAVSNLVGSGTSAPQIGFWSDAAALDGFLATSGRDGFASLALRLDSVTVNGTTTTPGTALALKAGTTNVFEGAIADPNGDGSTADRIDFTVTFLDDGTYAFDLAAPRSTTVTYSSANGQLGAGGPDAVQTLTIPQAGQASKTVVFFGVAAGTATAAILPALGTYANGVDTDLTEAQIEGHDPAFAFLTDAAMNVSTAGIGIGNNNLNGYGAATPLGSEGDESFVVNPGGALTKATVYIDNSVAGYNPATEALWVTIYYIGGTTSGPLRVGGDGPDAGNAVDIALLTKTGWAGTYFEVVGEGGLAIDAIQLSMGAGTIKIPVIEFTYEEKVTVPSVDLGLTATLTDRDGDSASASFTVGIETDDNLLVEPDLVYAGTAGADSFVFDLAPPAGDPQPDRWLVTGFDGAQDRLVLLGVDVFDFATNVAVSASGDDTITIGAKVITVANGAATLQQDDLLLA